MKSIHAYLLLLPAFVLLVAFTHYPAVATLIDSLFSTPKGSRPPVWVGLENYALMVDDPVFWKAATNNLWFALATIPMSIGLALVMALWVNERMSGRGFLRMAYFTPTILPMIAVANICSSIHRRMVCWSRSPASSACPRTTGSATNVPRWGPSPWWRSGRKPASS
jgi:sn-glycerol 3-phosphate transport system permease protein